MPLGTHCLNQNQLLMPMNTTDAWVTVVGKEFIIYIFNAKQQFLHAKKLNRFQYDQLNKTQQLKSTMHCA